MKAIYESFETFEAYAEIDLCYYGLKMLYKEILVEVSPIHKAINNASGYSEAKNNENKEIAISLIERVIAAKKIIETDYSNDEKMLNQLKK